MRLLILSSLIFLTSCISIRTNEAAGYGTYLPSPSTNYTGVLTFDPGFTFSDEPPIEAMQELCIPYGGLDLTSVTMPRGSGREKGLVNTFKYTCNKAK